MILFQKELVNLDFYYQAFFCNQKELLLAFHVYIYIHCAYFLSSTELWGERIDKLVKMLFHWFFSISILPLYDNMDIFFLLLSCYLFLLLFQYVCFNCYYYCIIVCGLYVSLQIWDLNTPEKSPTWSTKTTNMYGVRSKVLWTQWNLRSSLLSIRRWHGLATSHSITNPARPSGKSLLQVDAGGDDNSRNIKEWMLITISEFLRAAANRSAWMRLSVSSALRYPWQLKQSMDCWWWLFYIVSICMVNITKFVWLVLLNLYG